MTVAKTRAERGSWFVRPKRVFRPQQLLTVELRLPVGDVRVAPGHDLYVLAVLDGVPVGVLEVPASRGVVNGNELVARLEEDLGDRLVEELLTRSLLIGGLCGGAEDSISRIRAARPQAPRAELPTLTVAVCTRDRPEDLRRCLTAILRLDISCEVLVIDNAPPDDRAGSVVAEFAARCRYVREPRVGLNWARNRAVAEATGDVVAFVDDDVTVDPAWARRVTWAFAEDPDVMAVTGLVLPAELAHAAQRSFEDYGGFGKGFRRHWYRADLSGPVPTAGHLWATGNCGTGANMAFRRSVFSSVGLFDPALDVGTLTEGGGDLDMFFRVLKHGWTLLYEPAAFVWHRHRRTFAELKHQIHGFGSVASVVQAEARRFPEERMALLKGELSYLRGWHLAQLRKGLRPSDLAPRLARVDLASHGWAVLGRRYERAIRVAGRMHGGAADLVGLPELPELVLPSFDSPERTAIRRVSIDGAIREIADLAGYRSARLFVEHAGVVIGHVDIEVQGRLLSAERIARQIAQAMGHELFAAPSLKGAARRRSIRLGRAVLLEVVRAVAVDQRTVVSAAVRSVSIVVSTADRPESLRRCLASINRALPAWEQSFDVEVIVVQNGPDDGRTTEVILEFGSIKLVHEPRRGVSYGRNAGLAVATGEVVAILDDDEIVDVSWLASLIEPFADESVGLVTGNVLPAELETSAQHLFEQHSTLSRGHEAKRAGPQWLDSNGRLGTPPTWEFGGTANLAVRRSVFEDPDVGPFDEVLGPGTPTGVGEDTMLFYRVLARGHEIVYEPRAVSWHFHRRTAEQLLRQQRAYYSGHVSYSLMTFLRHGDVRGLTHIPGLGRWHLNEFLRTRRGGDLPRSLWWARVAGSLSGPTNVARSAMRARVLRKAPTRALRDAERTAP